MIEFLIIGAIGVALLLVSLVLGDLFSMEHLNVFDSELFSTASLAGFIGAFGFGGALAHGSGLGYPLSIGVGVVLGIIFAWAAGWLTKQLKREDPNALAAETKSLIGLSGQVISAIPDAGYGEVRVLAAGQPLKLNARSDRPLEQGTKVWVSDVLSATAVQVSPVDPLDALH